MTPFELVRTEAADHSVQRMCRLLGISRSGYYDYVARREHPPVTPRHDRLIALIRAVHAACEGACSTCIRAALSAGRWRTTSTPSCPCGLCSALSALAAQHRGSSTTAIAVVNTPRTSTARCSRTGRSRRA